MLKRVLFIILFVILIIISTLTWINVASKDVTLVGNVKNAYSKQWVYGAKITVDEKITFRYATTEFYIDGLRKGETTITAEAPDYEPQSIQSDLKRGENILDDILLRPLRIPDLHNIFVFVHLQRDHYRLEIRLANSETRAILHAPHLPLHVFCTFYDQIGEGVAKQRGEIVHHSHPDAIWDYNFVTVFPLSVKIYYKDIKKVTTGAYVLDTKIVIPNEKYSLHENNELFSMLSKIQDEKKFLDFIMNNELRYFQDTTWDIGAGH